MQTKLLVRNLAWNTSDVQLNEVFSVYGPVLSAQVIKDATGEARGFALVEMATQVAAEAAIRHLNMRELNGRQMDVKFANDSNRKSGSLRRRLHRR